jgi:predicted small secreted protein
VDALKVLKTPAALALTALLLTACGGGGGGGDDRATVGASLRHYFSTIHPEDSSFPTGAGPPRVKDNSCVKLELAPLTLPFDKVRVNGHVRC